MSITAETVNQWAEELEQKSPRQILEFALSKFDNIAVSFSGAEDVVIVDLATRIRPNAQVFTLDTGRLHIETYQYIEAVRKHYGINIQTMLPEPIPVENMVEAKGLFSFYEDGHQECCGVRKIAPLRRKLQTVDAWISGQRSWPARRDMVLDSSAVARTWQAEVNLWLAAR